MTDLRGEDELCDYIIRSGGLPDSGDALREWEIEGIGRGRLSCPWVAVEWLFGDVLPTPRSQAGDEISIAARNAYLVTVACSGEAPEVSDAGVASGVFASEPIEWWRSRPWSVPRAAIAIGSRVGMWPRRDYPTVGVDLTTYSAGNAARRRPEASYGVSVPGMTCATKPRHIRDLLAAGYGLFTSIERGFQRERDANGFCEAGSNESTVWSIIGYDDRPSTRAMYGEPTALLLSPHGEVSEGPRDVRGTAGDVIPRGCHWAAVSHIRFAVALSDSVGWPARGVDFIDD